MVELGGKFSKQLFQILEKGNLILQGVFYAYEASFFKHPTLKKIL